MSQLAWWFLAADLARAVELCAGLDNEFAHDYIAVNAPTRGDFQPFGLDVALKVAADEYAACVNFAVDAALLADGYFGIGLHRAFDAAVNMQVVGQGKVADQLCACCNDGRSGTLAVLRTTSANDSH